MGRSGDGPTGHPQPGESHQLISIIIPVLNETPLLEPLITSLESQQEEFELIFADGGSQDATPEKAAQFGRVVFSRPGRAPQMNAGAKAASGDILLFLHCDTRLPTGGLRKISEVMEDLNVAGGGFAHRFDRSDWFSRFISFSANTRSKRTRLFFGDQAIFIRGEMFKRMGGYTDMPLFEDWDLSSRMRREGKVALIEDPITTSGRRIEVWGKGKCFIIWWGLSILYALGVPAEKLARFYEHVR